MGESACVVQWVQVRWALERCLHKHSHHALTCGCFHSLSQSCPSTPVFLVKRHRRLNLNLRIEASCFLSEPCRDSGGRMARDSGCDGRFRAVQRAYVTFPPFTSTFPYFSIVFFSQFFLEKKKKRKEKRKKKETSSKRL